MRKNLTFTLLFSVLLVFCLSIEKSSAQWVQAGPNGGNVALLAKDGTTLYAAVNTGLYTSTDNGNTWTIILSPTWPGTGKALAKIGNYLFLASNAGIYRSADNGLTWVKKGTYGGLCLAANSTTIFAGTSGGVIRSLDNGETWTKAVIGSIRNQLTAVAATDAIVYSGDSYNGGVRQSTDNGLTWGACSNGASVGATLGLAIIGTDIYAGTRGSGIWKYTDGTGSWTQSVQAFAGTGVIVGDATVLFATSFNNVIRSTDGGVNWTDVTGNGVTRPAMGNGGTAVMSADSVYVGTVGGIYRTQNNGDTWVRSDVGIKAHSAGAIGVLGTNIYTSTASSEVFRSSDLGQNWTNISTGLIPNTNPTPYTASLATDATAVFYDVSMSTDAGNSWTETNAPGRASGNLPWLTQNGAYITCDPWAGVSRSTDNGLTWSLSMTGMDVNTSSYVNLYSDGSRLYVSTNTGPYYSTDDGQTWTLGVIDLYYQQMGGVFQSTGTCMLYGGTGSMHEGTFRSTDQGATWTQVCDASSERIVIAGTSIYISGRNTVAGTATNTLYRSDDDGQTWTNITFPVPQFDIYRLTLGASGLNVFISTGNLTTRNIWGSNDGGATWHIVTDNIYPATVATIVILNNKVFACGNSIWSRNLSEFTIPAQPTAITGSVAPCIGSSQTYSVPNVYGVTYSWMFPAGWVITDGGTTSTVKVTVGSNPGIVLVTPTNMFGAGSPQYIMITPNTNAPNQPSVIAGSTTPLEGSSQNYSVTNDPGVSYAWTFPAGWMQTAGGTTNAVTVTVGSGSGNITVSPSTVCGTGTARTLAVVPATAGYTVTFNVDMSTASGFNPLTDVVYLTGNFPGASWITPGDAGSMAMTQVGTTLIFTRSLPLAAGTYEYKYFKNAGWSGGEYQGGSNRSVTISGSIVLNDTWGGSLNWANLQSPASGTINLTTTLDVYADIYIPNNITAAPGATYGLQVWIGYNTGNTDPGTWTNWVPATFDAQIGSNDQYKAAIGAGLSYGTYYYASRFQWGGTGTYVYGGYNGGFWNGTTNVSGVLLVSADLSVNTSLVTGITTTTATTGGDVISDGGSPVIARGVCWDIAANPVLGVGNFTTDGTGTGIYVSQITGLTQGTTYHVRAYVTNSSGTAYGSDVAFTTHSMVTFNVDMSTAPGFIAGTDLVYLVGAFPGANWIEPGQPGSHVMAQVGTTNIYTITLHLPAATTEYKYFRNPGGWGSGEYTGGSNRSVTVTGPVVVNNIWGGDAIQWANVQWPGTGGISLGDGFDAYVQAYINGGVTGLASGALGLQAWVGYSTGNTDPSTWTNWVAAPFSSASGSNDEFKANLGASITASGTYYYASRFQLQTGAYVYGGFNGGFWNGTTNISGELIVAAPATKTLNIKLYLEGLYNPGTGLMNQAMDAGATPKFGTGIADQVTVELHDAITPFGIAYTYSNVNLNTDGTLTISTIPGSITGSYYVVIKHRNSIETWSMSPVAFGGTPISYDFSTAAAQAYGNNMKLMGGVYTMYGGDASLDGAVDGTDMAAIDNASTAVLGGYHSEDVNGDGVVDGSDMALIDNNSTAVVQVQRPPL